MKQNSGKMNVFRVIALVLPLLAAQLIWAQTSAVPQVYGVYGGTIGNIVAFQLPGQTNITRIFAATESPNSVFYGDVDHSKTTPFSTADFSFAVVPDFDANAGHGAPDDIAAHEQSGLLFVADEEDGLMSCDTTSGTIATNISEAGFQSILIEGSSLFAVSCGINPESSNSLYYGTLDPFGIFTAGAGSPPNETFVGTPSMAVHPVNHSLYVLTAGQSTTPNLKKSSAAYNAFGAATTFSVVSLPAGITNFSYEGMRLGIGPDGRIFVGGGMSTGSLAILYSDNDGTNWTEVDTGGMSAGGSGGINVETVGTSNAYEVYFGTAASSNKGGAGTWQSIPRGGHGISPSTHENAGCVRGDPLNSNTVYFTTDKGIGASTNRAIDIFELNNGLHAFQINDIDVTDSKEIAWLASKSGVRIATDFNTTPVWYDADFPDAIVFSAAMDKTDTNGLTGYAGSCRVYKTITGGGTNDSSWERVFNYTDYGISDGEVKAIEVDGSNVFVGFYGYATTNCEGGLFMSLDSGNTWTNVISSIDVNDVIFNTENGDCAVYVAVSSADLEDLGGIYRYVEGSGSTFEMTNGADIRDLAVDSSGGIYASGSIPNDDPSTRQVVVYYKSSGATTWTALSTSGLPSSLTGLYLTGRGVGPVITVGTDSSNNEIPVVAVVKTLYCLPYNGTNWVSVYSYPEGTAIKALYWDELLVGTEIGLYGQDITLDPASSAVVVGDFDGDGKADVAVYHEATGYWYIQLSGSGYSLSYQKFGDSGYEPAPADYDGDGKADVAVYHETTGYWYIQLSGSGYSLSYQKFGEMGYQPVPADYDSDGKADVAVYQEATGYWYVQLSGSGYSLSYQKFGESGYEPEPADYDGDGKADVAVYHEATGYWYIQLSGSGYSLSYQKFGEMGYQPVPADYDSDGKADVAVYHEATGYWYIQLSGSDYSLSYQKFGETGYAPVPCDYDGDGKADVTVYQESTGYWYIQLSGSGYSLSYQKFGEAGYTPVR